MRIRPLVFIATCVIGSGVLGPGVFGPGAAGVHAGQAGDVAAAVSTYCSGCHNGITKSPSGALLDTFDATRVPEEIESWSRAYRQLVAGTMPPAGAPRPDKATYDTIIRSIETALRASLPPSSATSEEIAERLAALLWDSEPDAALREDARRRRLADPKVLQRHIRRMLADERARAFVKRFFFPWLGMDRLEKADPDRSHFPDYDPALRGALLTETELFILDQLRRDADPLDLWRSNVTFLDERLARHYGIGGVTGARFRQVVAPPERTGLLGKGSVHMATSNHQHGPYAAYTSPAARAMWVRARFLGAPAPRPFPGAQPVKPELPITPQTRALPADPCENCHRNFFPLGYALENFDPLGRWRTQDSAGPVDATGAFVDGTAFDGVVALRGVLLQHPEAFRTNIAERLVLFASRGSTAVARPTTQSLIQARHVLHAEPAPRWSALIAAIVRSTAPER